MVLIFFKTIAAKDFFQKFFFRKNQKIIIIVRVMKRMNHNLKSADFNVHSHLLSFLVFYMIDMRESLSKLSFLALFFARN